MIDPFRVTSFDRSTSELEEFILNAIAFAGKNALQQSRKMHAFLSEGKGSSPFAKIRMWEEDGTLTDRLIKHKLGKYKLLTRSFSELARSGIDLSSCTLEDLARFPGIKSKTARFFILHSRPDQELVVIDTHVLKELRRLGLTQLRTVPSPKRYAELECTFIAYLKANKVTDFAAYDLDIWKRYTKNKQD